MGAHIKLDISNGQGRICPAFAFMPDGSNLSGMTDAIDIESIRAQILAHFNDAPIENVAIEWATPVLFIMPARSRHLYS